MADAHDTDALDALAQALRSWGEFAIGMLDRTPDEIREEFEGWARHAVVAAPRPGLDEPGTQHTTKDWPALGRFVREHRRAEQAYVTRTLGDLRSIIWTFVRGLGSALQEDRSSEGAVESQLAQLKEAVESDDTERLKREAMSSISLIQNQIKSRKAREEGQIAELSNQLEALSSELTQVKEQLAVDALTGAWNRAALDEHVSRVVSLGAILDQPAILFMIDVDDFKWVNDRYGHPAGDEILKRVTARLQHTFRRKGDFLARYGGDEFCAVILEDSLEIANTIGERLIYAVRELEIEVEDVDEPVRVSVSVGAARLAPGDDSVRWTGRADRALYQAKEMGRDRVVIATDDAEPPAPDASSA